MNDADMLRRAPPLLIPEWSGRLERGVGGALATMRHGGVSLAPYGDCLGQGGLNLGDHVADDPASVVANRGLLSTAMPARPAWLSQVHGVTVVDAAKVEGVVRADASFSTESGVVCAVLTADCLPVLFRDSAGRVVAAAHAGWRGLAAGILQNTVAAMRDAVSSRHLAGSAQGPVEIQAWLGPAIGAQRFEVGAEVVTAFAHLEMPAAFVPIAGTPGKFLADIYALARAALATVGVVEVSGGQHCTVSDQRFYSYRRDGVTGRQASLIWL